MRLCLLLAVVFVLWTASLAQTAPASSSNSMPALEHFSIDQVDKTLDPCADFFQYACSKWLKANPIPPDQGGWGTFNALAIWNVAAVRNTLEEAAKPSPNRTEVQQKVGDYYASCMDEDAINKAGLKPLQPVLDRIGGIKDKSQLPEVVASIHQIIRPANLSFIDAAYQGVLFGTYSQPSFDDARVTLAALDQAGMALPGREFYLNDDAKSKEIRDKYVKHVARMLELSGESPARAAMDAQSVLAMETDLAKAAMEIVLRRDPKNQNNKMSLQQVQALTPSFNWSGYFAAMHAPASPQYTVLAPGFFQGMEKLVQSHSIEQWQAYLRWSTLNELASSLSQPFVEEDFDFFGRTLGGTKELQPRWRRCSNYADNDLGEAVGQAYVAKYFPPENKERMLQMVKAIKTALDQDIDAATWMSDATKKAAHAKLAAQVDKIGYPDHWRDYSSVEIKRDDFLGNVQRASGFEIKRRTAKFGQPSDRYEWGMTPPTVNAYEDAQGNTINFPAGILQPPFFDASAKRCHQLWRHRRRDWTRNHSRLRRSGTQIRCRWQPERLVDSRRRCQLRAARQVHHRRVHPGCARGRRQAERQAFRGRRYGRQRRRPHRARRFREHTQVTRQESRQPRRQTAPPNCRISSSPTPTYGAGKCVPKLRAPQS